MTLSQDEIKDVFKEYIRLSTDLSQGMNYCINSKYKEGTENFLIALSSLQNIIDMVKSK